MDESTIERTLASCEAALAKPGKVDLAGLGFWKAVSAVKRRPDLVARYADRIARIDREAFLRAARPLVFPAGLGLVVEVIGTVVGIALVALAPSLTLRLGAGAWTIIGYVVGAGILIGMTHGLAHWIVGSAVGIRFTHWYSRPPLSPQPGFKIDYASYLRASPPARAWMHASGAIVSKIVPFVVAWAAASVFAELAVLILVVLGLLQILTDLVFSTRASDWKKFRREMRFA
jgi:hypothetical protein